MRYFYIAILPSSGINYHFFSLYYYKITEIQKGIKSEEQAICIDSLQNRLFNDYSIEEITVMLSKHKYWRPTHKHAVSV